MAKYAVPRGTKDILPDETALWQRLESACRRVFGLYNYGEIRTPIFEATDLFARSIGVSSDIVSKEMYEFKDRKGRSLTLRPEATAPVVRAALENNLIGPDKLTKLYYIGPMFRYERPQAGRQRQFHQAGVEVFGSADPLVDAEIILLNLQLFQELGLNDLSVNLNSVGCSVCRPDYRQKLKEYFHDKVKKMCADCLNRYETNTLRILDCKEAGCQAALEGAPAAVASLCPECLAHFQAAIKTLDYQQVNFVVNKRLVRGLDYYTRTTFEIIAPSLGAQNAISGGGRYDGLVETLGGKPTPAAGFAVGMERVITLMTNDAVPAGQTARMGRQECLMTNEGDIILYLVTLGEEAKKLGFDQLVKLRKKGISAEIDYLGRSLKAQLKTADRLGVKYVYIIGEAELKQGQGILKKMATAEQKEIKFDSLEEEIKL
ncbi:histidine--tRNA ligase [Candidatus Saganbacteria bacterium]|nr:histidine--tRNA ligase [Candidatus Saganbacteria bacterium]